MVNKTPDLIRVQPASAEAAFSRPRRRLRTMIIIIEAAFVASLAAVWLASPAFRSSRDLWVLFFFSFPSQFLVSIIPHEPVLLFFGKFYPPLIVAGVAGLGAVIIESINFSMLNCLADLKTFQKMARSRFIARLASLFNKAPFATLWIAGFLPIPYHPFRLMVAVTRYPFIPYILSVVTSRLPRFFVLALLGSVLAIPDWIIIILFASLMAAGSVPFLRKSPKAVDPAGSRDADGPLLTAGGQDAI